jgi:hypothetical protein
MITIFYNLNEETNPHFYLEADYVLHCSTPDRKIRFVYNVFTHDLHLLTADLGSRDQITVEYEKGKSYFL